MGFWDWFLVVAINGPIILYALAKTTQTKTTADWFLAGRSLPWWIIGLSMYATAIDSSDMVVDAGGAYQLGVSMFVVSWVGTVAGWVLMAHVIGLPMYRLGMYTNAEYLEARFGPTARLISVVVQVQFRTMVLGIIGKTIYLTLAIAVGWSSGAAWSAVVAIAAIATVYTMAGGLKAVAVTDAMQSVVMFVATIVMFSITYQAVDGWNGTEQRLTAHRAESAALLHVGTARVDRITVQEDLEPTSRERTEKGLAAQGYAPSRDDKRPNAPPQTSSVWKRITPAWLVAIALTISGMAYAVVNHTQSMRMFGAKSEWDFRMSVVAASGVLIVATAMNLSQGVMGRALFPDPKNFNIAESLRTVDAVFPLLVRELAPAGLKGIIVAGILAAAFSTYDSIGSTISALLTRDIYARRFVQNQNDAHYLRVGRWLTPVIIFGSFGYLPFLNAGMFNFYLEMVGAVVTPLLTIYLVGAVTRAARAAGTIGLIAGMTYGIYMLVARFAAESWGLALAPPTLLNPMAAAPASMAITALAMVVTTLFVGRTPHDDLLRTDASGWLRESELAASREHETISTVRIDISLALGLLMLVIGSGLAFWVFW